MALWLSNMDTPPLTKKQLSQDSGYYSSPLVASGNKRRSPLINPNHQLTYLSPGLVVSLCRRDLVLALVQAGDTKLTLIEII